MHKLVIEDDEGRSTVVPLIRDELTIGRQEGNAIRLTERNVSRNHARLVKQAGGIFVEDLGSYTGVRVNGVRIDQRTSVRDGDEIVIGDYKLGVRADSASDPLPATVPTMQAPPPIEPGATLQVAVHAALSALDAVPSGGEPSSHLDAAPTMPLRTLVDPARPTQPLASGRLVVVTSALAGMEFRLDRASLVIGRTHENDIVLNHPSISRHHAKVVRDGERYTVVDLQSANGVRVGGEPYERVDIQPGDVLELGHVKLRFVGAREAWVFNPSDYAPKSRRGLKIGGAVGGVVLATLLVVILQPKKAAPPVAAVPKVEAPSPATLFAKAEKAAEDQDWDNAVTTLDLLLGRPSSDAEAAAIRSQVADLKRKVDGERRAKDVLASFEQAVAAKEPDVALSRFEEIPTDSVYKPRAEPAMEGVKTLFLSAHLELAEAARTQGHCDDARAEVEKIQQIDPDNKRAPDILKTCRPRAALRIAAATAQAADARPAASAPRPTNVAARPAAAPARPARPAAQRPAARSAAAATAAPESEGATPEVDASDLIRQAREAWSHQQCVSAIDLSRRALRARPGNSEAHQIIAVCSCSSRDRDGALKSYVRLDERSREMVRTLCGRYGVDLGE